MALVMERIKIIISLVVAFIFSLAVVILTGRILDDINKSGSKSDARIQNAHKWAAWAVGISSAAAGISLIGVIALIAI